ncbi:hypothetical protein Plhal304r1_c010g0039521 [Plasmopara halstedii]
MERMEFLKKGARVQEISSMFVSCVALRKATPTTTLKMDACSNDAGSQRQKTEDTLIFHPVRGLIITSPSFSPIFSARDISHMGTLIFFHTPVT